MNHLRAATNVSAPLSVTSPLSVSAPLSVHRPDRLLRLEPRRDRLFGKMFAAPAVPSLERVLGLSAINAIYDAAKREPLPEGPTAASTLIRRLLEGLNVQYRVSTEDLARIPKMGPLVVVSNHPFGALDGLILSAMLAEARDDVRVMANYLLGRVPELRELFLLVDPFGGPDAASRNLAPMRQALRWLKDGHVLAAFPAGEVAHLRLANLRNGESPVTDPAWHPTIARIVRRAEVPVLPVFFDGRNNAVFQAAGLIHSKLRTALLPRAFLGKHDSAVTVRIGSIVPARRAAAFDTDDSLNDYLRRRTFLLRHGIPKPSVINDTATDVGGAVSESPAPMARPPRGVLGQLVRTVKSVAAWPRRREPEKRQPEPVIQAVDAGSMAEEIDALPRECLLLDHDGMAVYAARAPQIRHVLREIGRLREVTFRAVGEGTGRSIDLDTFDYDYTHLFIWDRAERRIVGAYRLGPTDELLPAKGRQGLYTSTLFNYREDLLRKLDPALEMGRSFVRQEYQKSYAPLLLLWKGIGHFVVRHPRYRYVFGPVSISNAYSPASRHLMVEFLKLHHAVPQGDRLAAPKNPFRSRRRALKLGSGNWDDVGLAKLLADDDEVSSLIADLEPDHKGIPVLVRQYLKLGAKFLAFNVDRDFGDCLDGLIVVDLARSEPRVLERYMTKPGHAQFMAHQVGVGERELAIAE